MAPMKILLRLVLSIIVASLAGCSSSDKISLTHPRMTLDEAGMQITTVYSASDDFHAVADLSNAPKGTVVSTKWFAVRTDGYEPGFLGETSLITEEDYTGYVSFQYEYEKPDGWPMGQYKAEMYLNGILTHTMVFTVQ